MTLHRRVLSHIEKTVYILLKETDSDLLLITL